MALIKISGGPTGECNGWPDCPKLLLDTDTGEINAVLKVDHNPRRIVQAGVLDGEVLGGGLTRDMVLEAARYLENHPWG